MRAEACQPTRASTPRDALPGAPCWPCAVPQKATTHRRHLGAVVYVALAPVALELGRSASHASAGPLRHPFNPLAHSGALQAARQAGALHWGWPGRLVRREATREGRPANTCCCLLGDAVELPEPSRDLSSSRWPGPVLLLVGRCGRCCSGWPTATGSRRWPRRLQHPRLCLLRALRCSTCAALRAAARRRLPLPSRSTVAPQQAEGTRVCRVTPTTSSQLLPEPLLRLQRQRRPPQPLLRLQRPLRRQSPTCPTTSRRCWAPSAGTRARAGRSRS